MDRVKGTTDVFTLKSFADVINSLDFTKVVIYDAHSNVTPALIDRVENRPNTMFVERTLLDIGDDNLVMYYPDEGAMKRYSENCQRPYSFGMKRRNWETGKILGIPDEFIFKAPEDGLSGKTDEDNLGFTYDELDNFLLRGDYPSYDVYKNIEERHKRNLHKVKPMPSCPRYYSTRD